MERAAGDKRRDLKRAAFNQYSTQYLTCTKELQVLVLEEKS